jgi:hypothetical protein
MLPQASFRTQPANRVDPPPPRFIEKTRISRATVFLREFSQNVWPSTIPRAARRDSPIKTISADQRLGEGDGFVDGQPKKPRCDRGLTRKATRSKTIVLV